MKNFKQSVASIILSLLVIGQAPMAVLANETATADPAPQQVQTVAPAAAPAASPESGLDKPAGADSVEYTENPDTGKWESDKYVWDPATGQTQPKEDPGYYYNPETGRWDTNEYVYRPETGAYEAAPMPQPASAATTASPATTTSASTAAGADAPDLSQTLAALLGLSGSSNANTGPNSTNTATTDTSNAGFFDRFSRAVVTNNLNSQATSGDATVTGNTFGGDATSGAAKAIANLLNLLNSAWSWANGGLNIFTKSIDGDHNGDITLNPGSAGSGGGGCFGRCGTATGGAAGNSNTGPDSTNTATSSSDNNLTVNSRSEGEINNNLNLLARSGNAGVTGNTFGGNATSGDALAEVNILNLINSSIGAGQSFLGLINIFGNLNGDVLFPAGFLNGLIGSVAVPGGG
ncbi:MAG TPA: hypothetical protein VK963_01585, partial [Candidatus Saccharimonadales bacterium]|nr:hypothetical protein [Candidatus Saccharimonadales bacterium]